MTFRPALRAGVTLVADEAGGGELGEPLLGRRMSFNAGAFGVVRRLDGTRTLPELAGEAGVDGAEAERIVRALLLLNLLDGAGDAIVARIEALARGRARLATAVLPEARFACQGSGDCCRNYALGPLRDEDVARLAALPLGEAFQALGGAPPYVERVVEDRTLRYLRTVDDHCVFLQEDERCGIHGRFGAAAKPLMCRLYPFEQVATIAGRRVYDKGSCSTFAVSARAGLPLAGNLPSLPEDDDLFHPVVMVGGAPCDYGHVLPLQDAACALVGRRLGDATATMAALGRLGRRFSEAMAACPLAPGEPEATAARACAVDAAELYAAAGEDARAGLPAWLDLVDELAAMAVSTFTRPDTRLQGHLITARRASALTHVLHLLREAALHALDPDAAPAPALAAIAVDEEWDEPFRVSFRQQLFGRRALVEERLGAGLLRLGAAYLVTRWAARLYAGGDGAARVGLAHFNAGHTLATRVLGGSGLRLFAERDAAAWPMLAALPALA